GTWSLRWDRYAGRDVLPLWVADTDFRSPQPVRDALKARVEHGVFGYTAPPEELRAAIVDRLAARYGWRVEPSWIVFLPGVVPGLHVAARRLLAPGERALVPTPVYQHSKRAVEHVPIASLAPEISRRTVTLMSANKAFNFPAAGCAWAVVEEAQLREAMSADARAHVLPSPSVFGYIATLAALREGDAWLAAQIEY